MSKKLLRKKLALMLASLKKKRKYYCEVEYLESTGTQWIDTGVKGKNNIDFDYKAVFTNVTTSSGYGIGGEWQSNNSLYLGLIRSNGTFAYHYANTASPVVVLNSVSANTPYVIQGHMWTGEQYMVINGTKSSVGTVSGTFTATENIALFRVSSSTPIYSYTKIYYLKIWDNGVLVRDMIPVLDWNMTPCMYDRVSGQFFYNAGTGDFIAGREIHYVDYIESTGTQYINTGHAFTDNFAWEITFDGIQDNTTLFGGRTSSARTALLYQRVEGATYITTCPIAGLNGASTPFQLSDLRTGRHTVKMAVNANKGSVWVDDIQVYNEQSFTGTYISGTTQAIFADNFGSSVSEYTSSKFYGLKMWQGSTIVRDFVPAIDENGVGFVLDRVTHTCYLNAGTGAFKYPAREVEYLESSGTQYIDTGYIASNTSGFSVKIMPLQSTDKYFIGSRPRTSTNDRWLAGSSAGQQVYIGWNTNNFVNWELNKFHTVQNNFMNSRTKALDGTVVAQISETLSSQGSRTAYLFSANDANAVSMDTCRIYGTQITEVYAIVRDLIPAYKDGVACMVDKLTGTAYLNQGTGTFTTGKIVEPEYE